MRVLGERWSILILREAFYGATRFDEFQKRLGVAPNILSARLKTLAEHGVLEKRSAAVGKRYTYHLTEKGQAFLPAYVALKGWADAWMLEGALPAARLFDATTGQEIRAAPLLRADGTPIVGVDLEVRFTDGERSPNLDR